MSSLQNGIDQNKLNRESDDVYSDIVEQIAQTTEKLEENQRLTDNKNLHEKLQLEDVKLESLKQILDTKEKELRDLNEHLKRKKADAGQHRNQRSHNFDGKLFMFTYFQDC